MQQRVIGGRHEQEVLMRPAAVCIRHPQRQPEQVRDRPRQADGPRAARSPGARPREQLGARGAVGSPVIDRRAPYTTPSGRRPCRAAQAAMPPAQRRSTGRRPRRGCPSSLARRGHFDPSGLVRTSDSPRQPPLSAPRLSISSLNFEVALHATFGAPSASPSFLRPPARSPSAASRACASHRAGGTSPPRRCPCRLCCATRRARPASAR